MTQPVPRPWFQFRLRTAIALMLVSSVSLGLLVYWIQDTAGPVGVLQHNREELTNYADALLTDSCNEGETQRVLALLRHSGAHRVMKDGGCVVIQFEFMPTDAVPELIYSPKGYDGLPQRYQKPGKELTYFRLTKVDDVWFFCEWDN